MTPVASRIDRKITGHILSNCSILPSLFYVKEYTTPVQRTSKLIIMNIIKLSSGRFPARIPNMSVIQNKKAHFNYEIMERHEAGIELLGNEVKSVRAGRASLEGAHITVRGGEAFLIGATINPYQAANTAKGYEPMRNRKLLLTKKELAVLADQESHKGLTIIPNLMYNKGKRIKVEIAVVRKKNVGDKREVLKKREATRDILRDIKSAR